MKHKLLIAAAAAALVTAPTVGFAQDSGVYIKGQVGYGVFTDTDLERRPGSSNSVVGDIAGEGNLAYGIGIGYDFGNNWRIELEGSQLYNDMGTIGGQPASFAKIRSNTAMLNLLYDFSDFGRWEPYVGAGVGLSRVNASFGAQDFLNDTSTVLVRNPACFAEPVAATTARACIADDTDEVFAWNLMAGLGYNITDNLTWDTSYRYTDFAQVDIDGTYVQANVPPNGGVFSDLGTEVNGLASHTLMTGFRYRFGKATPPPPPVVVPVTYTCDDGTEVTDLDLCPVPTFTCWDGVTEVTDLALCPPQLFLCPDGVTSVSDLATCPIIDDCDEQFRQELIYYEFDEGQSAETRNTINRILDVGQFCRIDSVRVIGHTDTSGPRAYNQGLSERRAADASEELVRQGVNAAMISSEGKGETEPFVQTGDGVREQLNRRTEVLLTLSEVGTAIMSN